MSQSKHPQNVSKDNAVKDPDSTSAVRIQSIDTDNLDPAHKDNETSGNNLPKKILEEGHIRSNDLLENLPVYLVLLTPDYHMTFANRFFRERFGESNGRRCFEYLFDRNEPCEACETYKVLKTMKMHRREWHGPDGNWYDIYDIPFTETDGSVLIMEVGVEITKRKKAEIERDRYRKYLEDMVKARTEELEKKNIQLVMDFHALEEAEESMYNLSLFPRENPYPVFRVSNDGIILHANPAAAELMTQWQCSVGGPIATQIKEAIDVTVASGVSNNIEIRCGEHDFLLHLVPILDRGYVNFYGHDVTELKKAQSALEKSEAHFKLLSETAERLIMWSNFQPVVNELCRETMAHLGCNVFFNYITDDKTGRLHLNAFAGISDEDAEKIEWLDYGEAVCGYAALDGKPIIAENIFNTPDIRTELVKSYGIQAYACHPLTVQGKVIGTLSFGTRTRTEFSKEDLILMRRVAAQVAGAMERARLINEIQRSKEKLEKRIQERTGNLEEALKKLDLRNKELQEFAFIASHDLREPIRKIQTFGAIIQDRFGKDLPEQAVDYFKRMQNAVDRMDKLLESLLGYSRVSTRGNPFIRADLNELTRETINDFTIIDKKEATIELGDLPAAEVDPPQFRQLIGNLIHNALKFNRSSAPKVIIRGEIEGDLCRIFVEDNGIGFDEQYLDSIFMPLQRLHGRNEYEGSGMGLAICAKVAERHGGNITARSKPGEGSTFIVTLPLRH
ncbi:MAG: GAF domain-containing protein [Deltaproteobacteria bacterium]|nr:GAF domain-containing protein [Deltaproteobacteria bacterium]